jgi:hypothetical protein
MRPKLGPFKKRTLGCPHQGCPRVFSNASGLMQHMQSVHILARHQQRSPSPAVSDNLNPHVPFNDGIFDYELDGNEPQRHSYTIRHPIIDGDLFYRCPLNRTHFILIHRRVRDTL